MTVTDPNDSMLDDLFAEARSLTPAPSAALMARVLSDAAVVQPVPTDPDRPGLWARLLDIVGGWPAVSGLAAATVAGIWVGVAPPSSVEDLTANLLGDEVSISLFSADLLLDGDTFVDG